MAGSSCKSGLSFNTHLSELRRVDAPCTSHGGTNSGFGRCSQRLHSLGFSRRACRLTVQQKLSVRGRSTHHHAALFSRSVRIRACNNSTDEGAAPTSSDVEEPSLTSAAEQKQAAVRKRLEAARTKATNYQQSTNVASALGEARNQMEAEGSFSDLNSDDDEEENSSGGGGGYGVMSLLLNQRPKKESFYKNAKHEMSKPAVLPDIEIVRGKKVVSERRPSRED